MVNNHPHSYPETIDDAIEHIISRMDSKNKRWFRSLPPDNLFEAYRQYGMNIRATLGLWGENPTLIACVPEAQRFADAASFYFIEEVWLRLNLSDGE